MPRRSLNGLLRTSLFLGLLPLAGPPKIASASECPVNVVTCLGSVDSTHGPSIYCDAYDYYGAENGASCDSKAGHALAHYYPVSVSSGGYANALSSDDFQLIGVPSSPKASFTVVLTVAGFFNQGQPGTQSSGGTLKIDALSQAVTFDSAGQLGRELTIPQQRGAGEIFRIFYSARASSQANAACSAQLFFRGLPPSASVISCNGFRAGLVTAARALSWGRLRSHYR